MDLDLDYVAIVDHWPLTAKEVNDVGNRVTRTSGTCPFKACLGSYRS